MSKPLPGRPGWCAEHALIRTLRRAARDAGIAG